MLYSRSYRPDTQKDSHSIPLTKQYCLRKENQKSLIKPHMD
ncbi:hypothetical protein BN903_174 [Halorubrum sp. AJ67]|nr:hypothetical protein BN903_174 [Halorubrum sp. AJ67]